MKMVHCNSKCLMCFLRNGTIGHGTSLKMLYDFINTLHLFKRDRIFCILKVHKRTKIAVIFLIHKICILFEHLIAACSCRLLKEMNGCRIVTVLFSLASHFVGTHTIQSKVCGKS